MTAEFDLAEAARRLVADLMPIAVTVSGPEAAAFVAAFEAAGAGADLFADGAEGFDLAVLLVPPGQAPAEANPAITALAAASDRLLFVPLPLGTAQLPELNAWFELFAEQGYQPVVEYDATFLGQGAFLVDRNAIAAEAELANFAERVSMGGALAASTQRVAALEAELADAGDRARLKAALAEREAALAECKASLASLVSREAEASARAAQAEADSASLREQIGAWQAVGRWVGARVTASTNDDLAALRRARGMAPRRGLLSRLRGREAAAAPAESALLADAALVRASPLFDAAWYIASQPELAESGADPVWHYLLVGAPAGADPGPWFDSAAYVAGARVVTGAPLVHAIRSGAVANR